MEGVAVRAWQVLIGYYRLEYDIFMLRLEGSSVVVVIRLGRGYKCMCNNIFHVRALFLM